MALPEVIDIDPVAVKRRKPDCTIDRVPVADPILPCASSVVVAATEVISTISPIANLMVFMLLTPFSLPYFDQPGPSRIDRDVPAPEKGTSSMCRNGLTDHSICRKTGLCSPRAAFMHKCGQTPPVSNNKGPRLIVHNPALSELGCARLRNACKATGSASFTGLRCCAVTSRAAFS